MFNLVSYISIVMGLKSIGPQFCLLGHQQYYVPGYVLLLCAQNTETSLFFFAFLQNFIKTTWSTFIP
jgi:hypothetical protein